MSEKKTPQQSTPPPDEPNSTGGSETGQPDGPEPTPGAGTPPRRFRMSLLYVVVLGLLLVAVSGVFDRGGHEASYDEFLRHLRLGHVEKVILGEQFHHGVMEIPEGFSDGGFSGRGGTEPSEGNGADDAGSTAERSSETAPTTRKRPDVIQVGGKLPNEGRFAFKVAAIKDTEQLLKDLDAASQAYGTRWRYEPADQFWQLMVFVLGPFFLIALLWFFLMRQSGQMGRTALSFGKMRAKLYNEKVPSATFLDVAGCDEAKDELTEVVDFLRSPRKYQTLGGRMPKGILLVGPPGTGKTLLARAVAGEAKKPFFHLSGSDFVEMFVGVGASRVRDLFQQAKTRAPCIIFVDELDAVGRHRGAGVGGGHDEREQTLNQLLVEMDGFDTTQGIILLAATNRPDVLDPALLRPGRFDRQVVIDAPDARGRRAILEVHAKEKQFDENVEFGELAQKTPGFTGADLANVINEAALLAARNGLEKIGQEQLDEAVERSIAGPERRSRRLGDEERRRVAVHEAGHALVAALSKNADPVRKISIVPRGHAALGYTMQSPEADRYLNTEGALIARLRTLLAGRAAEDLVFGEISTGAADDLNRATQIARSMVCRFGMSSKLGPVAFGRENQEVFLGRGMGQEDRGYSEASAQEIDGEVKRILEDAASTAGGILEKHRRCLDNIAETLLEQEIIQGKELEEILERELCAEQKDETPASADVNAG